MKEVAFGDVDGVQRNTSRRKKKRFAAERRTKNYRIGLLVKSTHYLTYKLEAEGIQIEKHDESYTTQQCPCCAKRRKVSSRIYKCSCGIQNHRDIHGASNFFAKTFYGEIRELDFSLNNTQSIYGLPNGRK